MNEVTELCNSSQKGKRAVGGEGRALQQEGRNERAGEETHIISPSLDLLVQLVLVLVPERRVAHQQDVEDHPWDTHKNTWTNKYTDTHTNTQNAHFVRNWISDSLFLSFYHLGNTICALCIFLWTTHHRPRCPQVCHMPPSSKPQGTDTPVCQQILQKNPPPKQLIDMLKAIDCVGAICGSAYIGSNIIFSKIWPIGPNRTEILRI